MNIKYRRNFAIVENIYNVMGYDINIVLKELLEKLTNFEYDIKEVISKIDVYSLGLQIPLLFYEIGISPQNYSDQMINDFYTLFKLMINPDLNERFTAKNHMKYILNL